ncbi:Haloacid dehalogenase hydrolase domain-containing protein 3 [Spatholobus suberectus]|nr:Haloacid dehalogenase hydrolase domain-containing protein 3 [Spatholobus suberectus]
MNNSFDSMIAWVFVVVVNDLSQLPTLRKNYGVSNGWTCKRCAYAIVIHVFVRKSWNQALAWHLNVPGAEDVFRALIKLGMKLAVVSNFNTRLRPLLRALNCDNWFDAVTVSAEVAMEKPNPTIFLKACELLNV